MRVDVRPRKRNAPRIAEKSAPGFLQWLRGRSCMFAFLAGDCGGKLEAMHLDFAGDKGMGTKASDQFSVPACSKHHGLQHSIGWNTFCKRTGIPKEILLTVAAHLWDRWPGRIAWERKLSDGA